MKNQALFSLKDKRKKLKCHVLQILFGALRVNFIFSLPRRSPGRAICTIPSVGVGVGISKMFKFFM